MYAGAHYLVGHIFERGQRRVGPVIMLSVGIGAAGDGRVTCTENSQRAVQDSRIVNCSLCHDVGGVHSILRNQRERSAGGEDLCVGCRLKKLCVIEREHRLPVRRHHGNTPVRVRHSGVSEQALDGGRECSG